MLISRNENSHHYPMLQENTIKIPRSTGLVWSPLLCACHLILFIKSLDLMAHIYRSSRHPQVLAPRLAECLPQNHPSPSYVGRVLDCTLINWINYLPRSVSQSLLLFNSLSTVVNFPPADNGTFISIIPGSGTSSSSSPTRVYPSSSPGREPAVSRYY